jgi:hypothetical protein
MQGALELVDEIAGDLERGLVDGVVDPERSCARRDSNPQTRAGQAGAHDERENRDPLLAKEVVSVAPAAATLTHCLQELFE